MEVSTRNGVFQITDKDIVLYNGACWQLISQTYFSGWHEAYPTLAQAKCKKWVKEGKLVLYKETNLYTTEDGRQMGMWYYKFSNVEN